MDTHNYLFKMHVGIPLLTSQAIFLFFIGASTFDRDKISDLPQLKAFAIEKSNVIRNLFFIFFFFFYRLEYIVGKGENADY